MNIMPGCPAGQCCWPAELGSRCRCPCSPPSAPPTRTPRGRPGTRRPPRAATAAAPAVPPPPLAQVLRPGLYRGNASVFFWTLGVLHSLTQRTRHLEVTAWQHLLRPRPGQGTLVPWFLMLRSLKIPLEPRENPPLRAAGHIIATPSLVPPSPVALAQQQGAHSL